jgi:hypothetical protein
MLYSFSFKFRTTKQLEALKSNESKEDKPTRLKHLQYSPKVRGIASGVLPLVHKANAGGTTIAPSQ